MKKGKGSGRPVKRAATKLAARKRPSPQPEFDVGVGPVTRQLSDSDSASDAATVTRQKDDSEFEVGEGIAFTPLAEGVGQDWYPLQEGGASWRCPYGCPGVRAVAADLEMHTWDCPYWEREGKGRTPFD